VKYNLPPVGQIETGPFVLTRANVGSIIKVNEEHPGILGAS
jgi:hypothetical protein